MRDWPNRIVLGGDYNPEQWPEEVRAQDVELMRRAGVGFVTLGVFAWSWLEPEPGVFAPEWLDEVMDAMAAADIAVDLATATASPPAWFSRAHPDTLPVDADGHVLGPGSRQAWCPSSTTFRCAATTLTRRMATRYHDHLALAMWHVSNEYGCHHVPCYCDRCAAAFRDWLAGRYGDVDALNDAWGTAFWSQRYTAFYQVLPPRRTPAFHNPGQVLDYRRFTSDQLLAQYRAEAALLRELSPGVPVTTNFMTLSTFRHLDYHRWAPHVDVVSTDHYLVQTVPGGPADPLAELSFGGDLTRGIAGGRPWVLREHSTSAVNWQPVNPAKAPGQTIADSLTHVAHGADGVGFFQWRASRAGSEQYHSGLVPHAGPDTRRVRGGLPARGDPGPAGRGRREPGAGPRRDPVGLRGRVVGRRPRHAERAARLRRRRPGRPPRAPGDPRRGRRGGSGSRPDAVRRRRGADAGAGLRGGGGRGGRRRERRRARAGHVLLGDRRRGRPGAARRVPGRVPRPARRPRAGVLPAAGGGAGPARRRVERLDRRRVVGGPRRRRRHGGAGPLRRRPARRAAGDHATGGRRRRGLVRLDGTRRPVLAGAAAAGGRGVGHAPSRGRRRAGSTWSARPTSTASSRWRPAVLR